MRSGGGWYTVQYVGRCEIRKKRTAMKRTSILLSWCALGWMAICLGCDGGDLPGPSKPSQKQRASGEVNSTPSRIGSLSDEERNAIWWEVEKSTSRIADAIQSRWSEKGSLSDAEFIRKLDKEIRTPIAEKHGITYDELKQLFAEGETASWRTNAQD